MHINSIFLSSIIALYLSVSFITFRMSSILGAFYTGCRCIDFLMEMTVNSVTLLKCFFDGESKLSKFISAFGDKEEEIKRIFCIAGSNFVNLINLKSAQISQQNDLFQ